MSHLEKLKKASTLHDVAHLLGFKPKSLSFILYKSPESRKYTEFQIPKKGGGNRNISTPNPQLKTLQSRLSKLLQVCLEEIETSKGLKTKGISHGFMRKRSIATNAVLHKKKRYVFNADISDFFGSINFGRVRGYFLKSREFSLNEKVATIIAQIACHDNKLPQGSPCSPIISNLIGHILDIRLAKLAKKYSCTYSRYADDLTFSTNRKLFPSAIAATSTDDHSWSPGESLQSAIALSKFELNSAKTRMQYSGSRQDVTGLVVNDKVNTRVNYRKTARAMVNHLLRTGTFTVPNTELEQTSATASTPPRLDSLGGMLSFIHMIDEFNAERRNEQKQLNSSNKVYKDFLFYKRFYCNNKPIIVCEGKTDSIYIRYAILSLASKFPLLAEKQKNGKYKLKVEFLSYTKTIGSLFNLRGGTGDLRLLVAGYRGMCARIRAPGLTSPTIILVDNDDGANAVFGAAKDVKKKPIERSDEFGHITDNLYLVPTPLTTSSKTSVIEDFFQDSVLATKLNGKTFSISNKMDSKNHYGKHVFAEQVIKKNRSKIDFSRFTPILERLSQVISTHSKR